VQFPNVGALRGFVVVFLRCVQQLFLIYARSLSFKHDYFYTRVLKLNVKINNKNG